MGRKSRIEWTDDTWDPITGCTLVSEGCRHCYAARLAVSRLKDHPSRAGLARINAAGEAKFTGEVRLNEPWLDQPLNWRGPRKIFVCANGDLFHERVPDAWIDQVYARMALCPQHTFIVLTKRPERARNYARDRAAVDRIYDEVCDLSTFPAVSNVVFTAPGIDERQAPPGPRIYLGRWPLPNVWLGNSIEDQPTTDVRIPYLLQTPAAVRFVSAEPLLGPVNLTEWLHDSDCHGTPLYDAYRADGYGLCLCRSNAADSELTEDRIDWVIVGGESGNMARPMMPDWARSLRDQCATAGVPFFFKQWGSWAPPQTDKHRQMVVEGKGLFTVLGPNGSFIDRGNSAVRMTKKEAGHLLDGVAHLAYPKGASA